jgi:CheY-like chemotaxis protein
VQSASATLPGTPLSQGMGSARAGGDTQPPLGPRRVASPNATQAVKSPGPRVSTKRVADDAPRSAPLAAAAVADVAPYEAETSSPSIAAALEAVLAEVRELRRAQDEMMEMLRARLSPGRVGDTDFEFEGLHEPEVRSSRRKSVLLVDDEEPTRVAVEKALERGEVPVRTVSDGNACLAAIAREKPDVIVLELGIGGTMAGKDVVNMIKATMEWVDIPIILYTRVPMDGQKEARQIHGADDYVAKGPGGPEAVLAKAISFFRRP